MPFVFPAVDVCTNIIDGNRLSEEIMFLFKILSTGNHGLLSYQRTLFAPHDLTLLWLFLEFLGLSCWFYFLILEQKDPFLLHMHLCILNKILDFKQEAQWKKSLVTKQDRVCRVAEWWSHELIPVSGHWWDTTSTPWFLPLEFSLSLSSCLILVKMPWYPLAWETNIKWSLSNIGKSDKRHYPFLFFFKETFLGDILRKQYYLSCIFSRVLLFSFRH